MALDDWFDVEPEQEYPISEYDLTQSPNDFNVSTLVNLIDSSVVKIPNFQRNYVWDIKRASRLIESLLIGLPVPQIFFFEQGRNNYLVIDGQQRLMTIFYFVKGRFPRQEKRVDLRKIFNEKGEIPIGVLSEDEYFSKFNLSLHDGEKVEGYKNKFHKKNYETLEEYKTSLNLRTIRSIIVKQTKEDGDDSALYELFNRLNTGGVNLTAQEIRMSLYNSNFMKLLLDLNGLASWRRLTTVVYDLHLRDVEFLLRAITLLVNGDNYVAPMGRFINTFSKKMKTAPDEMLELIKFLVTAHLENCDKYNSSIFKTANGKFSLVLFESVLYAACGEAFNAKSKTIRYLEEKNIIRLKQDSKFNELATEKSTNTDVLRERLVYSKRLLG